MGSAPVNLPSRTTSQFAASGVLLLEVALLLTAAFTKLEDISSFAALLGAHGLIPGGWTLEVAWGVVLTEVLVATVSLMLLMRRSPPVFAALLPSLLFVLFGMYAGGLILLPPPKPSPCGCGIGPEARTNANWVFVAARNFCMAGISMLCALILSRSGSALAETTTDTVRVDAATGG